MLKQGWKSAVPDKSAQSFHLQLSVILRSVNAVNPITEINSLSLNLIFMNAILRTPDLSFLVLSVDVPVVMQCYWTQCKLVFLCHV